MCCDADLPVSAKRMAAPKRAHVKTNGSAEIGAFCSFSFLVVLVSSRPVSFPVLRLLLLLLSTLSDPPLLTMPATAATPATTSATVAATTVKPFKLPADPAFKFEVSSPKYFHVVLAATGSEIAIDAGVASYEKKVAIAIPKVVQSTASSVYSFATPYVQWGYKKVVGVTAPVVAAATKSR